MAKITSKYQVTVPKSLADQYKLRPGDQIEWLAAGEAIRVVAAANAPQGKEIEVRLRLFDQATVRHAGPSPARAPKSRGWTRDDLYTRGRAH